MKLGAIWTREWPADLHNVCVLAATLLLLRHARVHFGKKFMHTYLHQVCDFANQSAIELLSGRLADIFHHENEFLERDEQSTRGGSVFTFGKADFQVSFLPF